VWGQVPRAPGGGLVSPKHPQWEWMPGCPDQCLMRANCIQFEVNRLSKLFMGQARQLGEHSNIVGVGSDFIGVGHGVDQGSQGWCAGFNGAKSDWD